MVVAALVVAHQPAHLRAVGAAVVAVARAGPLRSRAPAEAAEEVVAAARRAETGPAPVGVAAEAAGRRILRRDRGLGRGQRKRGARDEHGRRHCNRERGRDGKHSGFRHGLLLEQTSDSREQLAAAIELRAEAERAGARRIGGGNQSLEIPGAIAGGGKRAPVDDFLARETRFAEREPNRRVPPQGDPRASSSRTHTQ